MMTKDAKPLVDQFLIEMNNRRICMNDYNEREALANKLTSMAINHFDPWRIKLQTIEEIMETDIHRLFAMADFAPEFTPIPGEIIVEAPDETVKNYLRAGLITEALAGRFKI